MSVRGKHRYTGRLSFETRAVHACLIGPVAIAASVFRGVAKRELPKVRFSQDSFRSEDR